MKRLLVIAGVALVLVVGSLAVYLWPGASTPPATQAPGSAEVAKPAPQKAPTAEPLAPPSLGPLLARVQIVEFFDPACEACRAFYPHVKQILQDNAGTRLVLRYAPFHQGSEYVIRVLEAARMQGEDLYWKALETVLAAQPQWADHARPQPELVWRFLDGSGVDIERAKRDMKDPRITGLIRKDTADIVSLNVQRTPTFFVNDKPLREMSPRGLAMQVAQELAPD